MAGGQIISTVDLETHLINTADPLVDILLISSFSMSVIQSHIESYSILGKILEKKGPIGDGETVKTADCVPTEV